MSRTKAKAKLFGIIVTLALLLPAFTFIIGFTLGSTGNGALSFNSSRLFNLSASRNKDIDFTTFWDAWNTLKKEYNGTLTDQQLLDGAISGLATSTKDPYTVYLNKDDLKMLDEELSGSFEGIGAEIGIRDNIITVIAPLDGSPAALAGLRAGDKIFKIDDISTDGLSVDSAVTKIRGPKGTKVKLQLIREDKPVEITITRDTIDIKSVTYSQKGDIGYIKVNTFGEKTVSEFDTALSALSEKSTGGYIIDVRGNPGGYLNTAVDLVSRFVDAKQVVVWEKDKKKMTALKSTGDRKVRDKKVIVLIDEGSASASEIFSGALRDLKVATLIGEKSYGKGSVQTVDNLKQGALKITVAEWLTPDQHQINGKGLSPDITVARTEADITSGKDPQLDRALLEIKK